MIIDPADFLNRPYKVPNQQESRDFISFIEDAEEELAVKYLLGYEMWELFKAGLDTSGTVDTIWTDLRDGASYTRNNKIYHYKGWVDTIRPAIFSLWMPELTYKLTNVGMVENNTPKESKVLEDQYPYHVLHWNEFVKKVGYHNSNGYNCQGSLYGFLRANDAIYEEWVFHCPPLKNRYDF
jgi:hypothetical protein